MWKKDAQAFPRALVRSMVWMILALRQDAALLGFDADATRFSKKKDIYRWWLGVSWPNRLILGWSTFVPSGYLTELLANGPLKKIIKLLIRQWFQRRIRPVWYVRKDGFSPDSNPETQPDKTGGPIVLAARQSESEAGTLGCDGRLGSGCLNIGVFHGIPKNWDVNGKMVITQNYSFVFGIWYFQTKPWANDSVGSSHHN